MEFVFLDVVAVAFLEATFTLVAFVDVAVAFLSAPITLVAFDAADVPFLGATFTLVAFAAAVAAFGAGAALGAGTGSDFNAWGDTPYGLGAAFFVAVVVPVFVASAFLVVVTSSSSGTVGEAIDNSRRRENRLDHPFG